MLGETRTIGLLQTAPVFGAIEQNLAHVEQQLADVQADLIVLPELFATGYSFGDRAEAGSLAEPFPSGPTVERIAALSRQTGGMIVAGFPEHDGDRIYNAAFVVAAGAPLGCYRKLHLFGFEGECFDPGDAAPPVFEHEGLRVGVMICFDWMFPETARALMLSGADVIAHPSNLVLPGWCQRAMGIRALENRLYAVTANRHGDEARPPRPMLRFTGESQIMSPAGERLVSAEASADTYLEANVNLRSARSKRIPSGNDIRMDRRPEWYQGLVSDAE